MVADPMHGLRSRGEVDPDASQWLLSFRPVMSIEIKGHPQKYPMKSKEYLESDPDPEEN